MNTPIAMRCSHVGCDQLGKYMVAVVLFADPEKEKAPLFQKIRLPKHRRCKEHQPKFLESLVSDDAWSKMRAWFADAAAKAGRGAVVPVKELSQVIYFQSEVEFDMIEVMAIREDGALEKVGKVRAIR